MTSSILLSHKLTFHDIEKQQAKAMQTLASRYWSIECRKVDWPKLNTAAPELRVVDLFAGCGGLTLGALIACLQLDRKLRVVLAADVWSDANDVYQTNFHSVLDTISTLDLSLIVKGPESLYLSNLGLKLADAAGLVDVVVAGPPCQGHSDLNNSSRRDDPRNMLYTVPVAFGLQTKAKVIVVENVPSVIHATSQVVTAALEALSAGGYSVVQFLADAQDFGLPQTRKRHFLIASRMHTGEELGQLFAKIPRRPNNIRLWDFIGDLETESEDLAHFSSRRSKISLRNQQRIMFLFASNRFDLPNHLRPPCHREKQHSYRSMYGRLQADLPAQTITSGFGSMGQGRFVHPTQRRMITPHEAARIQGFPDYFKFAPIKKLTALREMIGNAVAPPIAAVLLTMLFEGPAFPNPLSGLQDSSGSSDIFQLR
ncbi:DNA cytosine methyltransferase [Nitrosovibrio tenuis]|uniref:DNA (cytosine-5-)-methyltransferase n=1 Tax=Nitrosovibrio tenuis TaxID=1233 RepID=A0A1H7LLS6_9PROT|nr:DNA cytosine methyltransferase [Nitrosovibrio tenuis]SEK99914.1 DNA (cytosine-5)-methyltransferase 1 [Nitrosovibrio tenuis]